MISQSGLPNSGPLQLQKFLVETINRLGKSKQWKDMAIIIVWNNCGGYYDHVAPILLLDNDDIPIQQHIEGPPPLTPLKKPHLAYCFRVPFLVISPYSKPNYIDHTLCDLSSIIRFIEDNWLNSRRIGNGSLDVRAGSIGKLFNFTRKKKCLLPPIFLDPETGEVKNSIKKRKMKNILFLHPAKK